MKENSKLKKRLFRIYVALRGIYDKMFPIGTKGRMIVRDLFYLVLHPFRGLYLIFIIKKMHPGRGDHTADILFLKQGKIKIKKESSPMVSIIIPAYNQLDYTYKCIKSISKNTKDVSYEIIVGNDQSTDGTKCLDIYINNVIVATTKENVRFLKNCNNATRQAKGKYIFFLNNDTTVEPQWLSTLVELIESDKKIGMVGSKLIFPDGKLQEAGGIIYNDGSGCNYGKFDDANKPQFNYVREVDYISGAAIMLSKKLWNEIGGFDELFAPAYCEDSDLAFEVRKRGLKVMYQPKSVVVHFEGISNGRDTSNQNSLKYYQIENNIKLKEKWKKEMTFLPSSNIDPMNIFHRDRIINKKVVLFVDHYVPEFDKDAGSRTVFQYLKLFVKKGYHVKFLTDNFYNNKKYAEILEQMGIEVLYGVDYRDNIYNWILINKSNIDFVFLNRPHISVKYIDFIKNNTDIKIIYYGHDLHFLREEREYELTKDSSLIESSKKWKKIELDLMEKADKVYYPSFIEKNVIKKINKDIDVEAINAYIFDNIDCTTNIDFSKKEGLLFVGGFNHRPNVDGILWFAKKIYPIIKKQLNIPLYIVGSNAPQKIKDLSSSSIIVKGFVTDEELNELYEKCKITVIPLRYGAGIKGKVVESMSKGIPFVTTSVGAEGIVDLETIVPVEDDEQKFANSIIKLYKDNNRLSKISSELRKYVSNNFSSEAAWKIIKNDFKKSIKYEIITPDGYGSKGDEAMIRGLLNLLHHRFTKLITQRSDLWTKHMIEYKDIVCEEHVELCDFQDSVSSDSNLVIIGADLIDGTQGLESSLHRLEAAEKAESFGNKVLIFCSFRSNVNPLIIDKINTLGDNVTFFLRDSVSIANFKKQTLKECQLFPDLAFFINGINSTEISKEKFKQYEFINSKKYEKYKKIGLDLSETSFRSMNYEINDDNRKVYAEAVVDTVLNNVKKPYLVLFSHDTREWENSYSDTKFCNLIVDILKERKFEDYCVIDAELFHVELNSIISKMDFVITGRMHTSILSFKSKIIPIMYTGKKKIEGFEMADKGNGMFKMYLGDSKLVVHDLEQLKKAIILLSINPMLRIKILNTLEKNLNDNNNYLSVLNKYI